MVNYRSYEYRINHRYEASGRSEFAIVWGRINPDGSTHYGSKTLHEVRKRHIGKNRDGWEHISNDFTPRGDHYIFFNTFEKDWYHTKKVVQMVHP
jgi:hypothetical protein